MGTRCLQITLRSSRRFLCQAAGRARLAFVLFFLMTAGWGLAADKPAAASEYQLKAAFLFNFVKFTEWPSSAFASATAPVVICVLGEDPFGRTLDDLVKGESINGRPIVVQRLAHGEAPSVCHVLFISRSEKKELLPWLQNLMKRPVLTVSDLDGFCEAGGIINLVLSSSGTVRPEINPEAARAAGIQISSRLLKLPTVRLVKTQT
jgi:hypothetical protein